MSDSAAWPVGVDHVALQSVDSTNAEAFRGAAQFDRPTWISAARQTAGRGRRAQAWTSPPGNLYATLAMRVSGPPQVVALRSFVAALALRDALIAVAGQGSVLTLKWPNDVLLNDGKVAGILLEAQSSGTAMDLAIGIGVNLASHPQAVADAPVLPVSLWAQTGLTVTPKAFLPRLATAYARREAQFCRDGFAPIRAEWLAHAARLGQPIRARTGGQTRDGVFQTIDDQGSLILAMRSGTVAIAAAEVFF